MSTVPNQRSTDSVAVPFSREVNLSKTYFLGVGSVLRHLPFALIDEVTEALWSAYVESKTVYVFGNGGSAALASHCACDLGKGTVINGNRRLRVLALTDNVPLMTALANDISYDDIFAEQLTPLIEKGDIALAISGSGNSPNVLKALQVARQAGAFTIGLTGFQGGKMKPLCDLCVIIPSDNMQVIEDLHVSVNHSVFTSLRLRMLDATAQDLTRQQA
jgi:D-sedoheptulose 7-phosphate isomerase